MLTKILPTSSDSLGVMPRWSDLKLVASVRMLSRPAQKGAPGDYVVFINNSKVFICQDSDKAALFLDLAAVEVNRINHFISSSKGEDLDFSGHVLDLAAIEAKVMA